MTVKPKKKLIEVALPLPEINDASAYDKMPGIGPHPKGIHHWWARLPLPTARAILFASVVDDPASNPDRWPTEKAQDDERDRLFDIIRLMMTKKLHEHDEVYAAAREEMLKHCGGVLPPVLDPFSGGGSIPLEASRLGFAAHAADLNPVAVLLNKCNLEFAPRWVNRPPVNPDDRSRIGGSATWRGTDGLAADIRFYAGRVRELSTRSLSGQYPLVSLPDTDGAGPASVVAWIWTHTVASPNPAARGKHVPIASTYVLAAKGGMTTWIDLVQNTTHSQGWASQIRISPSDSDEVAKARLGAKSAKAQALVCLLTQTPIERSYVQAEGKAQRLGTRLLAVVVEGPRGRIYLPPPTRAAGPAATPSVSAEGLLDARQTFLAGPLPTRAEITGGVCTAYGLSTWGHLFSDRQLSTLIVLGDSIRSLKEEILKDVQTAGLKPDEAQLYVKTVTTFLGLALDRCADFNNMLCRWSSSNEKVMNTFGKQALPMVFDYAEANTMGTAVGSWKTCSEYVASCVKVLTSGRPQLGEAHQGDAASSVERLHGIVVSTDPPYYDNISYATLSDFFYVWLRRALRDDYPDLFATMFTPKKPELIASPDRFEGDRAAAKAHFESGFRAAFASMREAIDPRFPLTVYYAYRQSDAPNVDDEVDEDEDVVDAVVDRTTGWQTLLEALIGSGFQITATWPVRASQKWRMVSMGTNALASYIVLACRPRSSKAVRTNRRSFLAELQRELPPAVKLLQQGNVAPVDLAQAAMGPGMAVYSRYSQIVESNGSALSVRAAIAMIDQVLGEGLSEQEVDFDADTRWALAWFEQSGFAEGEYGVAETLSKAKNTAVSGLVEAGILKSGRGKVRLLKPSELPKDWDPATDTRLTAWETVHHLIRVLEADGEGAAAVLAAKLGSKAEVARELCYRLYTLCERKKRAPEALAYNGLVQSWPEIMRLAREAPTESVARTADEGPQTTMFANEPTKAKKKPRGKKS